MLTRVGDLGQQRTLASAMLNLQARTRVDSQAVSSQKANSSYREMSDRTGVLLRAEDTRALRGAFVRQNDLLLQKLQVVDTSLASVIGLAERAKTTLVQRLNGATGMSVPLESEMTAILGQVEAQLNASFDGEYLFAGSATGTPAVQLPSTIVTAPDPSLFYQGDSLRASARIDVDQELEHGILAADAPFTTLIAGLGQAMQAHQAGDQAGLAAAFDQIGTALDGVIAQRGVHGTKMARLESTNDLHQSALVYLNENISDLVDVDVAEVMTRLASDQASLEATYLIAGRLNGLSLADYLR